MAGLNASISIPGNCMHWDLTPETIATETDHLIGKSKAVYDVIGALPPGDINYDSVVKVTWYRDTVIEFILIDIAPSRLVL